MGEIRLSRVYDHEQLEGPAFLVERLWPRGVRRDDVRLDGWLRDAAPSADLRKWFGHDPQKWPEFKHRYAAELDAQPQAWQPLIDAARGGGVTLLFSSRDVEHNNAVALREYLEGHLSRSRPGKRV